jgi:hypothetical protein
MFESRRPRASDACKPPFSSAARSSALKQSWKPDIGLICRSGEDRQPLSFWGSSAAEVSILAFLHAGGTRPNPATLAVNDALLPKLA